MTEVDLIEMVCDWTAMSQEFGQDGGSARGWRTRRSAIELSLMTPKKSFIYDAISQLDRQIAANEAQR